MNTDFSKKDLAYLVLEVRQATPCLLEDAAFEQRQKEGAAARVIEDLQFAVLADDAENASLVKEIEFRCLSLQSL